MIAVHWREITCVEDPLHVVSVPGASPGRSESVFPFPAIRDSRWDRALDALASALDLSILSALSHRVPRHVRADTAVPVPDRWHSGSPVHLVYRGGDFERVWRIACRYCQLRDRAVRAIAHPEELGRWLLNLRGAKPRSITVWGIAPDFAFPLIEAFETTIHASYFPAGSPCLGYMVAEDSRQLLWLALKTLLLWHVQPMSWPDGMLAKGDDDRFQFLPERPGRTRRLAHGDVATLRDTFDYLGLALHGRGYDAQSSRSSHHPSTICTQRGGQLKTTSAVAILGPQCSLKNVCFREEEFGDHEKVPIWDLRARVLFINSCASWRVGDSDTNYSAALAIRALDGFCTAYVGSRYEKPDDPRDDYRVMGAWKAGLPIGAAVRFASSAVAGSDGRLHLFSLVGDPEQMRLQGADNGCDAAGWDGAGALHLKGVREATVAISSPAGSTAPRPETYRVKELGEWALWLRDVAVPGYRTFGLYLLELPTGPDGSDMTLLPTSGDMTLAPWASAADGNPADAGDRVAAGKWVTARLLEVAGGARNYADFARGTWQAYAEHYWPGPVAQYGEPQDGPQWGQSDYRLEGNCPGCGLATMRTTTAVEAWVPGSDGTTVSMAMEVVDVFCPRCYQVGFFPTAPARLDMPSILVDGATEGRVSRYDELVVEVRVPYPEEEGALWIAVAPSERHVAALAPLPEPQPLCSGRRQETFRLRAQCLLPGIHHIRAYFCRGSDCALSVAGRMIHVV